MTVESEGSVSGHQEAMVILFYCFDKISHNSAIQEFSKSISKKKIKVKKQIYLGDFNTIDQLIVVQNK